MKQIIHLIFFLTFHAFCILAVAQLSVIPKPSVAWVSGGEFSVTSQTVLHLSDPSLAAEADFFNSIFRKMSGYDLKTITGKSVPDNAIQLRLTDDAGVEGKYALVSLSNRIQVAANSPTGILYGLASLLQTIQLHNGMASVPLMNIGDEPYFEYRGLMLDVSRHFRSKEYIKQLLDHMALLKMNVFHWHLTDDQGWRIEIKKYPRLTEVGAWRNGTIIGHFPGTGNDNIRHGGYYTQEDVKEIVQYAAKQHITVVPEIEMPGHSSAAIAAYPWLSCFPDEETVIPKHPSEASKTQKGKKVQESWGVYDDVFVPSERTFTFLQDVIDEIVPLFPGKYIHIGGDECPKASWKRSDFCQQLIKEKDLKDEHGLQSYFIRRMEQYINAKGKQIIGWDEILEGGLAPNATVMSWRGEAGGIEAAKQRHNVIMTPTSHAYFDYSQTKNEDSLVIGGFLPLEKVYSFNPIPTEIFRLGREVRSHILGGQANIWTEYIPNNQKLEYMVFPRIAAMAEATWIDASLKSWPDFEKRIPEYLKMLDKMGVNYFGKRGN